MGLILLLVLGAPLNLALPHDMAGTVMPGAVMSGANGSTCPGMPGGDRGSRYDHASLCLFCVALGGPSLAGDNLELAPKPPAPAVTVISFDYSRSEIAEDHRGPTQCCRDPPATVGLSGLPFFDVS
jgi:hypothetical protein